MYLGCQMSRAAILAFVLPFAFLTYSPGFSAEQSQCKRFLGPVCLREESSKLLAEVEKLYGKSVELEHTTEHELAFARTEEDGTPWIKINPWIYSKSELRQEATVVHELFHLKFRASGYPLLGWESNAAYKANALFLEEMAARIFDTIQHVIFYPQMRQMELDPSTEFQEHFLQLERGGGRIPPNDRQRAVFFMKAFLEFSDRDLIEKLEQWYKAKQWHEPLATGKELAETIINPISSPEDTIHVFVRCMNILVGPEARFSVPRWEERYHGPLGLRVGVVRVESLSQPPL
jgi:hypothetical protein